MVLVHVFCWMGREEGMGRKGAVRSGWQTCNVACLGAQYCRPTDVNVADVLLECVLCCEPATVAFVPLIQFQDTTVSLDYVGQHPHFYNTSCRQLV